MRIETNVGSGCLNTFLSCTECLIDSDHAVLSKQNLFSLVLPSVTGGNYLFICHSKFFWRENGNSFESEFFEVKIT